MSCSLLLFLGLALALTAEKPGFEPTLSEKAAQPSELHLQERIPLPPTPHPIKHALPELILPAAPSQLIESREDTTKEFGSGVLRANGKVFRTVAALGKCTETFGFGPNRLVVQIDAVEGPEMSNRSQYGRFSTISMRA